MKKLYKDSVTLPFVWQWVLIFFCGAAYIVCCLPSFYWIGNFPMQMVSSLVLSFLVTAILYCTIPRSLRVLGGGLSLFLMAMIAYAVYRQVLAQLASGAVHFWWIYTFFYDRPLTVAVVWGTAFAGMLLLRLILPYREAYAVFRSDFSSFLHTSLRFFMIFYGLVLIYCFILQRQPGGQTEINLIPFSAIRAYFRAFDFSYEVIFYLIGNILCFLPIGFYVAVRKQKTPIRRIVLVPVVCSLLIEVSQLIFHMGQFDIDDIIMNAVGYYIGFGIARLFDRIRVHRTAGEETTIFQPPVSNV